MNSEENRKFNSKISNFLPQKFQIMILTVFFPQFDTQQKTENLSIWNLNPSPNQNIQTRLTRSQTPGPSQLKIICTKNILYYLLLFYHIYLSLWYLQDLDCKKATVALFTVKFMYFQLLIYVI